MLGLDPSPPVVQVDPLARQIFAWFHAQPLVSALIVTMTLDILSGVVAAVVTKKVSSTASWQGMSKKALIWLVVGMAAVVGQLTPQVPVTHIVCSFYVVTEALSILENAGRAGVPLPKALVEVLQKLQSQTTENYAGSVVVREASLINVQPQGTVSVSGDPITGPRGPRGEKGEPGRDSVQAAPAVKPPGG